MLLPNEFGFQSPFSAICKRGRSNEPYLKEFRNLLKKNTVAAEVELLRAVAVWLPWGAARQMLSIAVFPGLWLNIDHS